MLGVLGVALPYGVQKQGMAWPFVLLIAIGMGTLLTAAMMRWPGNGELATRLMKSRISTIALFILAALAVAVVRGTPTRWLAIWGAIAAGILWGLAIRLAQFPPWPHETISG